jgi:hypothetical protein
MSSTLQKITDAVNQRISLMRWRRDALAASQASLWRLRRQLAQAWALRRHLDSLIFQAEYRLSLPSIGNNAIKRPLGADWAWRPDLWRGKIAMAGLASAPSRSEICTATTLFHDCKRSELTLRQIRNTRESDIAPFGLRLDVFRFSGSFLSLALDLPSDAIAALKQKHIFRVDIIAEMEKPLEIFARLNIKHGPNVESIVREMPLGAAEVMVEFDLGYSKINEKRVEKIWLDLIFEGPEMNQIVLRDLTITRRPRAEL